YDCCLAIGKRTGRPLTAFYPSSVFVEDGPAALIEYSMAKLAGESLCSGMNRSGGMFRVIVKRLPRLRTDQTVTVPPVAPSDPLEVMLPVIREVQATRSRSLHADRGT